MVAATPRRIRARTPASRTPSRVRVTSDGVEVTLETDPDDSGTWTTEYAGTFDHPSGHATVTYEHADAGNLTFDGVYRYGYDAWSEIEERNGSNLVLRQQVWGLDYIDELVVVSTNLNPQSGSSSQDPDPQQCDVDHHAVLDAQFNVLGLIGVELEQAVALVNGGSFSGSPYQTVRQTTAQNPQGSWPIVVVERYEYTPYGQRQVYRGSDNGRKAYAPYLASARLGSLGHSLNPFGYQGLKHDEGIGLVYNRARMLHPGLGRFVQRDPLGYVDGMSVYEYVRSNPNLKIDPSGEASRDALNRAVSDNLSNEGVPCCRNASKYWEIHYSNRIACIADVRKVGIATIAGLVASVSSAKGRKILPVPIAIGVAASVPVSNLNAGAFCDTKFCFDEGAWRCKAKRPGFFSNLFGDGSCTKCEDWDCE